MVEVKQIEVPEYGEGKIFMGTRKLIVKWLCPTCGEKMGKPFKVNLVQNELVYSIDMWENPCGHHSESTDLLQFQSKFSKGRLQETGDRL